MNNMDEIDYDFAIKFWENQATELLKENKYLNAELTYWKETAEHYKNEAKELEKPKYQTSISEELKNTIEKVNKTLDK